ncbi:IclR family transcriptional regulator [Paenibacillus sp. IB182496]|uniref:IclR family transcriptional regulator n=1 Tax=Paenibacillus sabuli TaxID=2772509 RepID=A0A927BXJ9_9BACL|nr:IclR family transcriptional regulator [Paenibacillus sabuli]MBD2847450.1 IclR family transcriptional regulator [Paenibacillus sabuli]
MEKKYWVPALEKATRVIELIAAHPNQLKLIDLSRRLEINKSSMFSLLHTMEELRWVVKDKGDTYTLSSFFGQIGSTYFRQYDLTALFHQEAGAAKLRIGETIQLAKLEGDQVLYLAKEEVPSPVRLASDPGMKLPAHSTALGKALLAACADAELEALYPQEELAPCGTPYTIASRAELLRQLIRIREEGAAFDLQEAVVGFSCVAAPVFGVHGETLAAVSCSMPQHHWERKAELAEREIRLLAQQLSQGAQPQSGGRGSEAP